MTVFITYNEVEYTIDGLYVPIMKAVITSDAGSSVPEDGGYWRYETIEPEPEGEEAMREIMERASEQAEMFISEWR